MESIGTTLVLLVLLSAWTCILVHGLVVERATRTGFELPGWMTDKLTAI